jgi:hypothetical protein
VQHDDGSPDQPDHLGGVFVAGVITYNKWQEHKARKTVERAFSSSHDDVLMSPDEPAAEPVFAAPARACAAALGPAEVPERAEPPCTMPERKPAGAGEGLPGPGRVRTARTLPGRAAGRRAAPAADEAVLGEAVAQAPQSTVAQVIAGAEEQGDASRLHPAARNAGAPGARALPVDELIDCNIPIALDNPLRGDKLLPMLQNLRHVGNKPVHFIGRTTDGDWEAIAHGGIYDALLAGAQLANRSNAINEIEYSELVMRLRDLTDALSGEPELPDMPDVIRTAQALHQFIADHDAQLSVNVRSQGAPGAWRPCWRH